MPLIPPLPSPRTTQTNTPGECRSPGPKTHYTGYTSFRSTDVTHWAICKQASAWRVQHRPPPLREQNSTEQKRQRGTKGKVIMEGVYVDIAGKSQEKVHKLF